MEHTFERSQELKMIYDYLRWIRINLVNRYRVQPIEKVGKEFPLDKQDQKESQEEKEAKGPGRERPKTAADNGRLSIWV